MSLSPRTRRSRNQSQPSRSSRAGATTERSSPRPAARRATERAHEGLTALRARLGSREATLMPGRSVTVELEVTNDLEVIDGVSVEVRPEKGLSWSASPQLLPLFPEGTGVIVLQLEAAPTYLAGRH